MGVLKFLRKAFGPDESRPMRGDTRVTYWQHPDTGKWNFHVQDGNNEVLCQSTQGYNSEASVLDGIENAREAFETACVVKRTVADQ